MSETDWHEEVNKLSKIEKREFYKLRGKVKKLDRRYDCLDYQDEHFEGNDYPDPYEMRECWEKRGEAMKKFLLYCKSKNLYCKDDCTYGI